MSGITSKTIIEDLSKSGLSVGDAEAAGWYELGTHNILAKLKEIIGFASINGNNLAKTCTSFLVLPYHRKDFARVRLYPPVNGTKYLQPRNVPVQAYIPDEIWELRKKPNKPIIITEGEKKTLCLLKHNYNAIGLSGVWCFRNKSGELLDDLQRFDWRGRTVHICFDSDAIFNQHVRQAEIELAIRLWVEGAKVYIIRLPQPNHTEKQGVDDFIVNEGSELFQRLVNRAKPIHEAYSFEFLEEVTKVLAKLYDSGKISLLHLKETCKKLCKTWKIGWSDLFNHVLATAKPRGEDQTSIVEELEPFDGDVDGIELADEIEQILKSHVVISSNGAYVAIVLWVFLTYVYKYFSICPMILITSPTKRCGKTTLLETLEALTNKALVASNLTPAAAFRVIDKCRPTLLADEADAGLRDNEELRGIFNAGHTKRTAFVIRCGDKKNGFEPIRFNVYCPKAIAAIRKLPDTWEDRGIKIRLERKAVTEKVTPLGLDFFEQHKELRQKLLKWAIDNADNLNPNVETPNIPNDRGRDNWRPLLAIAKILGADWLEKAQQAMIELEDGETEDDLRIELLKDIKDIFERVSIDRLSSDELVEKINSLTDRPWADFSHGKGLTTNKLAKLLSHFNIKPKTIRIGNKTPRGYLLRSFKNAFDRYVSPAQSATTQQPNDSDNLHQKQSATQDDGVAFRNRRKPASDNDCDGVTVEVEGNKEKGKIKPLFGENNAAYDDYEVGEI